MSTSSTSSISTFSTAPSTPVKSRHKEKILIKFKLKFDDDKAPAVTLTNQFKTPIKQRRHYAPVELNPDITDDEDESPRKPNPFPTAESLFQPRRNPYWVRREFVLRMDKKARNGTRIDRHMHPFDTINCDKGTLYEMIRESPLVSRAKRIEQARLRKLEMECRKRKRN